MPAESYQTTLVALLQSWSPPGGASLARILSWLGGEQFYLLLIPCLLWFAPWATAVKAARAMVLTDLVGEWVKWMLQWPRPDAFLARAVETSPGFVSTHAALSAAVAVVLGAAHRRLRPWLALWVLGVGWSRIYLGVHFPLDVLGGWLLGGSIAWALWLFANDSRSTSHVSISFALAFLLIWPEGGVDSLQRDLGMLLGLELGLLLRLHGQDQALAPSPLTALQGGGRLLLLLSLYVGLKALGWPRLLRYLLLGLVASWRHRKPPG